MSLGRVINTANPDYVRGRLDMPEHNYSSSDMRSDYASRLRLKRFDTPEAISSSADQSPLRIDSVKSFRSSLSKAADPAFDRSQIRSLADKESP